MFRAVPLKINLENFCSIQLGHRGIPLGIARNYLEAFVTVCSDVPNEYSENVHNEC